MSTWMLALALTFGMATAESQPVTVNRVIIVGNRLVASDLIRRCVNIAPGDRVNVNRLRLSQNNLMRLGVFTVDPDRGVTPTVQLVGTETPGLCDVVIQVQERK